jgi:hypothetical protein
MDALERVAEHIELVSTFRSFDGDGDAERQQALRSQGAALAERLVQGWRSAPPGVRPSLWFTYHVYYKAPDWLGPGGERRARHSRTSSRRRPTPRSAPAGPGRSATRPPRTRSRTRASCSRPRATTSPAAGADPKERIVHLPPFLDAELYRAPRKERSTQRQQLRLARGLDPAVPWIVVAAMMRAGDKVASYRELADGAFASHRPAVAPAGGRRRLGRAEVEKALERAAPGRTCFLGTLEARELAMTYAACDLYAWPAVNEAYGMSLLEAQAAGVPVVSRPLRGVPDVVMDGRTGLLTQDLDGGPCAHCWAMQGGARRSDATPPPLSTTNAAWTRLRSASASSSPRYDPARPAAPRRDRVERGGTHPGAHRRASAAGPFILFSRSLHWHAGGDEPAAALRADRRAARRARRGARAAHHRDALGRLGG